MKNNNINVSAISLLAVFALVTACHTPNTIDNKVNPGIIGTLNSKTRLSGKAEFPGEKGFATKANVEVISSEATVSLIYAPNHPTNPNKTVATGLTDSNGNFTIIPSATFTPALNEFFIIEAVKRVGRGGNAPLTVSTFVRWNGNSWDSITTPELKINSKTTAITIIAGYNLNTINMGTTINAIVNDIPQNINGLAPVETINSVADLVNIVLSNNYDPVQYIRFQGGQYVIVDPAPVVISTPGPDPTPEATPATGEFRINTTTTGDQAQGKIAMDNDGDFVVAWMSKDGTDTVSGYYGTYSHDSKGIFAQRYNAAGVPQGPEFLVNTYVTKDQNYPDVAMDSNGDFVITWQSTNQDGSGYGIYAKRYNSLGEPQTCSGSSPQCDSTTGEFRVNAYLTESQMYPSISMSDSGNFVIAWQSAGQDGSSWGVFTRIFNSSGVPQGSDIQANTYTNSAQGNPSVSMNNSNDFLIAWNSPQDPDGSIGIYARKFNQAGAEVIPEFRVSNFTTKIQDVPSVAMDDDGDFVIGWESGQGDPQVVQGYYGTQTIYSYEIMLQRYNANGTENGPEFQVNNFTANNQSMPAITNNNTGNFIVAWNDITGAYGQQFNSSGAEVNAEHKANISGGYKKYADVAMDNNGNFTIIWTSYDGQDGSGRSMYGQRYNSNGVAQ
jgi:hypothetical protein